MGSWGPGLYENDDAGDVVDLFWSRIRHGYAVDQATAALVEVANERVHDGVGLSSVQTWAAVGDVLFRVGHLPRNVALWACSGLEPAAACLGAWASPTTGAAWLASIDELRRRLTFDHPRPPAELAELMRQAWEHAGEPGRTRAHPNLTESEMGTVTPLQAAAILGVSPAQVDDLVTDATLAVTEVAEGKVVLTLRSVLALHAALA